MLGHVLVALLIMLLGWALLRNWHAGAFAASAWAVSREITQAEYRWIERFGEGLRANMPWWGGFDPRIWTKPDPWLDGLVPILVTTLVSALATHAANTDRNRHYVSTKVP